MTDRIEIYRTRSLIRRHGGWRWRYVAANGNILASGESYSRRTDMLTALERVTGTTVTDPDRYSRQGGATGDGDPRFVPVVWVGPCESEKGKP